MKMITHKQAQRYMRADLDGLLTDAQSRDLDTHLRACETCRVESESLATLTARLKNNFQARWDTQNGPSTNVIANIHSQTRRIIMKKRIDFAFNILGGAATLLILFFVVTSVISQFQKKSTSAANETQVFAPAQQEPLIAFVMTQDYVNGEIYTMKSDGSDLTNITNNPATDESPAWSPDGKQIAFVSDRSGGRDIYIMNADGSNVRKLTDSPTFNDHFSWSPDGTKIAYLSDENPLHQVNQLMVMNADGSNKIALTKKGSYRFLGWSPDGKKIVFQDLLDDFADGFQIQFIDVDDIKSDNGILFLGEGKGSAYQIHWETSEQIVAISSNGTENQLTWKLARYFTTDALPPDYYVSDYTLVWSNSPIVALFDKTHVYVVEDQNSLTWFVYDGAPIPLQPWNFSEICKTPTELLLEETTHIISPDKQQDFVRLQCPEGTTYFFLMNSDGTEIHQLGESLAKPLQASDMEWSADGSHVLVTVASNKGTELYRFDIQEMVNDPTIQPIQLATDSVIMYGAVWQPIVNNNVVEEEPTQTDSRLLAFTSEKDGNLDIYTMRADGSNLTNLTNNEALDLNPAWSPDGKRIAFESNRAAFTQIYLMNADGSNVTQLTYDEIEHEMSMNYAQFSPWSPDGSHLLFFQRLYNEKESAPSLVELYSIDINGENKIMLASGNISLFEVAWSPDGRHVAFSATDPQSPETSRIYVVDADGSNFNEITKSLHPNERLSNFNHYWSRNGQSVIFIASNEKNGQWTVYESNLDGSELTKKAGSGKTIQDWHDGNSFIVGFQRSYTWLRSDGTTNTMDPWENCNPGNEGGYGAQRSNNGNFVISGYCPNGDHWFYWANSDGTEIKQLLDSPIHTKDGSAFVTWSHDDQFIAINITSLDQTHIYILNVEEALKNPSIQPAQIVVGGDLYYIPSWQPIP